MQRVDLVLGQVHDLARTRSKASAASSKLPVSRLSSATSSARGDVVGVGLGDPAGGGQRLLGLAERAVHLDEADHRRGVAAQLLGGLLEVA